MDLSACWHELVVKAIYRWVGPSGSTLFPVASLVSAIPSHDDLSEPGRISAPFRILRVFLSRVNQYLIPPSLSLSLLVSYSLSLSLCLLFFLPLSLSLFVSYSLSLYVSCSFSLSLSMSLILSLSLFHSFSLILPLSLSLFNMNISISKNSYRNEMKWEYFWTLHFLSDPGDIYDYFCINRWMMCLPPHLSDPPEADGDELSEFVAANEDLATTSPSATSTSWVCHQQC